MNGGTDKLTQESIRSLMSEFWSEALELEATRSGLSMAVPQTFPDGWQVTLDLDDQMPSGVKVTDRGRTLGWLAAQGQNIETDTVKRHLESICHECRMERDGLELYQWIAGSIEAVQIHIFAEALVNVAHLCYLRDLKTRTLDVPDQTLQKVFKDHRVEAVKGHTLDGHARKKVRVDYLVANRSPMAFQIIREQGKILNTMERWGFRWNDLRAETPTLRSAMIYDPHHQQIDRESRAIGEDVCELFCSYEDTEQIHEFLGKVETP